MLLLHIARSAAASSRANDSRASAAREKARRVAVFSPDAREPAQHLRSSRRCDRIMPPSRRGDARTGRAAAPSRPRHLLHLVPASSPAPCCIALVHRGDHQVLQHAGRRFGSTHCGSMVSARQLEGARSPCTVTMPPPALASTVSGALALLLGLRSIFCCSCLRLREQRAHVGRSGMLGHGHSTSGSLKVTSSPKAYLASSLRAGCSSASLATDLDRSPVAFFSSTSWADSSHARALRGSFDAAPAQPMHLARHRLASSGRLLFRTCPMLERALKSDLDLHRLDTSTCCPPMEKNRQQRPPLRHHLQQRMANPPARLPPSTPGLADALALVLVDALALDGAGALALDGRARARGRRLATRGRTRARGSHGRPRFCHGRTRGSVTTERGSATAARGSAAGRGSATPPRGSALRLAPRNGAVVPRAAILEDCSAPSQTLPEGAPPAPPISAPCATRRPAASPPDASSRSIN